MPQPTFILVRPQHPGNIGAAARAIRNFGWKELRLVDPIGSHLGSEAMSRAVGGKEVLRQAQVYETLEEALNGFRLVIGTSRRAGKHRELTPVADIGRLTAELTPEHKMAILFGSEEKGLTNDDLALCQAIVTIPTDESYASLNLAHSVAIVAYALTVMKSPLPTGERARMRGNGDQLAPATELEAMYQHLEQALANTGFFPHGNPGHTMRHIRNALSRAKLRENEVSLLRGMARQIEWALAQARNQANG